MSDLYFQHKNIFVEKPVTIQAKVAGYFFIQKGC